MLVWKELSQGEKVGTGEGGLAAGFVGLQDRRGAVEEAERAAAHPQRHCRRLQPRPRAGEDPPARRQGRRQAKGARRRGAGTDAGREGGPKEGARGKDQGGRGEGPPPVGTHRRHLSPARRAAAAERRCRSSRRALAYDDASLRLPLVDLGPRDCRWPVNSPEPKGEYLFCGHQAKPGSRYCPHHVSRSVLPPRDLRHDAAPPTCHFCNQLQKDG